MRGKDQQQLDMFSYVSPEQRVPQDHPLRSLRAMTDKALQQLKPRQISGQTGSTGRQAPRIIRDALVPLNGIEEVAEILDPLPNGSLVVVVKLLENRSPDGHVRCAVSRYAESESKYVRDVFLGERSAMALSQRGEIRRLFCKICRDRSPTFPIRSMTRGAVVLIHLLSRRKVAFGELQFVGSWGCRWS